MNFKFPSRVCEYSLPSVGLASCLALAFGFWVFGVRCSVSGLCCNSLSSELIYIRKFVRVDVWSVIESMLEFVWSCLNRDHQKSLNEMKNSADISLCDWLTVPVSDSDSELALAFARFFEYFVVWFLSKLIMKLVNYDLILNLGAGADGVSGACVV